MSLLRSRVLAVALCLFAFGCDDGEEGTVAIPTQPESAVPLLGADCDPMVPTHCGLPFPSNVYLQDDPSGTGKRVEFGPTTLPPRADGTHAPPELFHDHDGFSPSQAPMTHLPRAKCAACAAPYSIEYKRQVVYSMRI